LSLLLLLRLLLLWELLRVNLLPLLLSGQLSLILLPLPLLLLYQVHLLLLLML